MKPLCRRPTDVLTGRLPPQPLRRYVFSRAPGLIRGQRAAPVRMSVEWRSCAASVAREPLDCTAESTRAAGRCADRTRRRNSWSVTDAPTASSLNPTSLNPTSLNPTSLNPTSLNPTSRNPTSRNPRGHAARRKGRQARPSATAWSCTRAPFITAHRTLRIKRASWVRDRAMSGMLPNRVSERSCHWCIRLTWRLRRQKILSGAKPSRIWPTVS
jgi:hypothetical protein